MSSPVDVVVVGAGAAGLMAAIRAGRGGASVLAVDGAAKLGAKILVAGGGRCNVTHERVSADDYAGASRNAIRKVLSRFDVPDTVEFFRELGVELKREPTGKLFPTSNSAKTVLEALVNGAKAAGVGLRFPYRVQTIRKDGELFTITGGAGDLTARRVILATGGRSLPTTGSDGGGYLLAKAFGHTITDYVFPALVPLTLPDGHFLRGLSGITIPAALTVQGSGRKRVTFTDSTLFTHFGLSGPSALNISRYFTDSRRNDPTVKLLINFVPDRSSEAFDEDLLALGKTSLLKLLTGWLPERLARALCEQAGVLPTLSGDTLPRDKRRALVQTVTAHVLPISGDRGFNYAEVTAGGVPLTEIHLETMESRMCPGVFLCGELCDVDGRIGGFNFQWAWASGYVAGGAAVAAYAPARLR